MQSFTPKKNLSFSEKLANILTPSYLTSATITIFFLGVMIWLISNLISDGLFPLASALSAIAVFIAMVYLRPRFTPYRWLGVGIALALMFTVYPLIYTVYLSVTNMGSGHLMSKQQAITRLEALPYYPEDGRSFSWTAFESSQGDIALWLVSEDGTGILAKAGEPLQDTFSAQDGIGEIGEDGVPAEIQGYERLSRKAIIPIITDLSEMEFGLTPHTVRIHSLSKAVEASALYKYDSDMDAIINQQTGDVYRPIKGTFTSESGEEINPGYIVFVGFKHFTGFLGNKGYRDPLGKVLIWNLEFTFLSVFFSLAVGLIAALMFEDLPGRRIIRALLIVPWPIPVLVSVLIWRSMLHPDLGFVAPILESLFGSSPAWFQNPFWTRFALVMINVWLSYPYFYVLCAGAMRAIPEEIYSAAVVDGANPWQKFRRITLPLILNILSPLIIASLTFNFNNFNVIYIFNFGNPPMANTIIPMGHTDILISFVYQLAFISTNVTNYGLAAAMTVLLFLFISLIVVFQIRFGNMFKEVD